MEKELKDYIFAVMPIIVTAFFVIVVTLISPNKWLTAVLQIPAWIALIWWLYMAKENYELMMT